MPDGQPGEQVREGRRVAARLAHEINTPLATIALCAESLLRRCEDPAIAGNEALGVFPRHLATMRDEVFRCKRIIEAVLDATNGAGPERADPPASSIARKGP